MNDISLVTGKPTGTPPATLKEAMTELIAVVEAANDAAKALNGETEDE